MHSRIRRADSYDSASMVPKERSGVGFDDKELVKLALKARERAYAPYSHFAVGAALLAANGQVFLGCNIENAAYSPSNCAERTAFFKAVSEGVRSFLKIAIVGGQEGKDISSLCAPCGVCRQVMREFCDPHRFTVLLASSKDSIQAYSLAELLPLDFGPDNLTAAATPHSLQ